MLSMSDKYDSANERTREISESIKLHILWVWQMPMTFITQLANSVLRYHSRQFCYKRWFYSQFSHHLTDTAFTLANYFRLEQLVT